MLIPYYYEFHVQRFNLILLSRRCKSGAECGWRWGDCSVFTRADLIAISLVHKEHYRMPDCQLLTSYCLNQFTTKRYDAPLLLAKRKSHTAGKYDGKNKRKKRGVLPACSQHCFRACAYLTITYISGSLTAHNSSWKAYLFAYLCSARGNGQLWLISEVEPSNECGLHRALVVKHYSTTITWCSIY